MTVAAGSRLGPYEILAPIGAGGMGEVYKARDTRLERTVAVKVLPQHLSKSEEVRQRFEREAKTISQLSHPHICALYDVGNQDGVEYLVMELLEGETLADRLLKGALPTEQVLRFGIEIADALDKAHRQGIVHRDLKPGNVMLTKSGVKLLDFGLAKVVQPASQISSVSVLQTQAGANLTQEGTILGTFQYMSPEQLEGREADARSDIFAFGAVLYEMATGRKAFSGSSQASLISAIMKEEPAPIATLQPMAPPAMDRVVRTCLAKDPEDRFQTAHDVKLQLQWIAEAGSAAGIPAPVVARRKSRERMAWAGFAIAALAAALFAAGYFRRAPTPAQPVLATLPFPEKMFLGELALSPDGNRIVFTALKPGGQPALWIRSLRESSAHPVVGAENAYFPFWSPDSRFIGFFADGKMKRMDPAGGAVLTICDAERGVGGTWNRDGTIVFAPAPTSNLYRVAAGGGKPVPVTKLDAARHENAHRYPQFLPDGRHFFYMAVNLGGPANDPANAVRVGSLDGRLDKAVVKTLTNAAYSSGYLLYAREGTLLAQRFDLSRLETEGDPLPVVQRVGLSNWQSFFNFSASESGMLVTSPLFAPASRLVWLDRGGKETGAVGEPASFGSLRLSPDGRKLVADIYDAVHDTSEIWVYDTSSGNGTRFVSGTQAHEGAAVWSPDGARIVFASDRRAKNVRTDLWIKPLDGGKEELFADSGDNRNPEDWSRDGRYISCVVIPAQGKRNFQIWTLDTASGNRVSPFAAEAITEGSSRFSPDGRWIAYASDQSGTLEVYVRPFPSGPGMWQISTAGGGSPAWRRDGKELYYLGLDFKLMAVPIGADEKFHAGSPVPLFPVRPSGAGTVYDVTADGQRFLVNSLASEVGSPPLDLHIQWTALLGEELMPLAAGARLGPYEVLSAIGAGGMGEVYKARDTRLDRTVAVKVLPQHLSKSEEVRQRFEREAKTISSLSHPHICALYDVGNQDGVEYLVMEFLEGETLADRLGRGTLPAEQVMRFGIEMADALDKAHRQGIVHRDLKPGNVMLTKSGVKLLDFGLAKAVAPVSQQSGLTSLPTMHGQNLTQEGTILGTFQYMAPEQLEGREADARTDIFAFGAVLYEMATGRKAFAGTSQASLISAIMKDEPAPIAAVHPMSPPALDRVVRTCLAKDPEERWQSAHDIKSELAWIAQAGSQAGVAAPVVASRRRRDRLVWGIAGVIAGALAAVAATWSLAHRGAAKPLPVARVTIPVPAGESLVTDNYLTVAISPDGRRVVYVGKKGDTRQLSLRALDAPEPVGIAGTEGAYSPFFSPDGQWVGFWADGKIKKVLLPGGVPVTVCECGVSDRLLGASWGADDTIVFTERWAGELFRVPAAGGTPRAVTKIASKGENRGHIWPEILPGGKAVLYTMFTGGSLEDYAIGVVSLKTGEQKTLIKGGTFARYAPTGHILYARGGSLFAVPFDAERLELTGPVSPVAQGIFQNSNGGAGYALSANGTLLIVPGGVTMPERSLVWVDRQGTATSATRNKRPFASPRISPDGRRVATVVEADTYDIWLLDLGRDSLTRLSFGKDDANPAWSPDGKRVVFNSSQAGAYNLYSRQSDGSGSEERLTSDQDGSSPMCFSPDGKLLVFQKVRAGVPEIWIYPFEKGVPARPFLQGPYRHEGGYLSPDGRWLAYESNESGKVEVHVTAFPGPGGKWQISTDGGASPRWAPDGREIFYRKDKKVMRAAISTSPDFSASRPEVLFEGAFESGWDIAPDGKRFLMNKDDTAETAPKNLNLVLNWFEDLKSRAPGRTR